MLLGVGLGSWNSCLAIQTSDDASVEVIANAEGDRVIPTCFHWGRDQLCGTIAKQYVVRHAQNTIYDFVHLLALEHTDERVVQWKRKNAVQLDVNEAGQLGALFPAPPSDNEDEDADEEPPRFLTITQLVAEFLKYLKSTAETFSGVAVSAAVITKPVSFSKAQVVALGEAAAIAGLPVLCIIDEPVAAINQNSHIHSTSPNPDADRVVAVVDLGGTESTLSIVALRAGLMVLLHSASTSNFCGLAIDALVQTFFCDEFRRKYKLDVMESRKSRVKLLFACEQIKVTLSKSSNAFIAVDSLHQGIDFNSSMHRLRFEGLCDLALAELKKFIATALAEAGIAPAAIDDVMLVGGVSQIPVVQDRLKRDFGWTSRMDADPVEVFALGAVIEGQTLLKLGDDVVGKLKNGAMADFKHGAYAQHVYGIVAQTHEQQQQQQEQQESTCLVFPLVSVGQPLPVQQLVELEVEPVNGSAHIALVRRVDVDEAKEPATDIVTGGVTWRVVDAVRLDGLADDAAMEFDIEVGLNANGVLTATLTDHVTTAQFALGGATL